MMDMLTTCCTNMRIDGEARVARKNALIVILVSKSFREVVLINGLDIVDWVVLETGSQHERQNEAKK